MDISNAIRDFYNEIADDYANDEYENDSLLTLLECFTSLLPPSPMVLDMGCGAGYRCRDLNSLGAMITGIDISEKAIQIVRDKNPDCLFAVMDFMTMSDSLGRFDAIISIATLIHVPKNSLPIMFSQISKCLNENGFLLLIVSDGNGEIQSNYSKMINDKQYEFVNYYYDEALLSRMALEHSIYFKESLVMPEKYSQKGYKCYIYQKCNR